MKKIYTIFLLLLLCCFGKAQLVSNPSFELDTIPCSSWALDWVNLAGDAAVMRVCDGTVAENHWGFQTPFTGDSYLKICTYGPSDYREYVGSILTTSIDSGEIVSATMYVSACDSFDLYTSGMGIFFSNAAWVHTTPAVSVEADFCYYTFPVDNTLGWLQLTCNFTAHQDYDRIELGNTLEMPFLSGSGDSAFMFVDQVVVSKLPINVDASIDESLLNPRKYLRSTNMLGQPCAREGARIDWYDDGAYRKILSLK